METVFELPFFRLPEKRAAKAWPAWQGWCSYPLADISSFALRRRPKVLAILMKACFDRGLSSGKRPANRR
ncbi:hypothetical protein [Rhizobium lentis]|uniref:Uncharacterized protein n=1 Tax=Rhizobium lentis TaxID=1138194 RepID=A0A9Q3QW38_9HYPH|nr:hypothetical protein [Rhizobium lentis]MBX4974731.1 hypothetical protein [Rhizobium lentis]MBX4997779.1 hypothetical protein [Rhizobium lentis]MBX5009961.1 hypothetical protein [Rhizobium lentis]MBX5022969.1 hypothetical protein [Rhizobium lentis]MBX5028922.1 hypothetical protein [Rhizobium lentis]